MADFRIKYGLSLGIYDNFKAKTDGLITAGDTTPDVSVGSLFFANNSSPTTITFFDGVTPGGQNGVEEGKVITVGFLDGGSTSIANTGQMFLSSSANTFPSNSFLTLIHHNSAWYEIARSRNTTNEFQSVNIAGTASFSMNQDTSVLLLSPTALSTVLVSISGGRPGQKVTLIHASSNVALQITTAGNIFVAGTNAFTITGSGSYNIVKRDGTTWAMESPFA